MLKSLLLGSRAVIGEIEAFLDDGIDIDRPMPRWSPGANEASMFLTIESARLPCCDDLFEVALRHTREPGQAAVRWRLGRPVFPRPQRLA